MMDFLQTFDAERVDMQPIIDRSGRGNDKLRVLFEINDKQKAKALYEMVGVNKVNHLPNSDQWMQIYFLLPEQKFEEYADTAAAKYYTEQEERKKEMDARRAEERQKKEEQRNKRNNKRNNFNNRDQQASETGIKFANQPPKFTSTKSGVFTQ